jgi:hypothetical protein
MCSISADRADWVKLDSNGILNAMYKHSNNQIIVRTCQRPIMRNELYLLMHSATVISKED